MVESHRLHVVHDGPVLRVTFDDPARRNAIDYHDFLGIRDVFTAVAGDDRIRAVLLTGAGDSFCSGANLDWSTNAAAQGVTWEMVMDAANAAVRAVLACPVPVVARVTGAAAGGGASLAFAADLCYATPDAYFLLAFINIGLVPDFGASGLVAAAAGRARAAELALLGERFPASEAAAAGLITGVLEPTELDARIDAVLARFAHGPRRAFELTKQAINAATLPHLDAVLQRERSSQLELLRRPEFAESVAAMLARRKG